MYHKKVPFFTTMRIYQIDHISMLFMEKNEKICLRRTNVLRPENWEARYLMMCFLSSCQMQEAHSHIYMYTYLTTCVLHNIHSTTYLHTVLHLLSSHLTHFGKKWDWQDRSLNQSEDSNCQILCQILFLSESSLSSPKLYQMAEPCSNLAQILLKPRSNLAQTLLKPCSNLAQTSLKPCSNLAQTFFKSHSNLVQISFKPRSDLVQT